MITFIVFARAPDLGRVTTRLAAALGELEALAIYRQLGEHTLSVVRGAVGILPGSRIVVYHTPADASAAMAEWLGRDLEYRAQSDGDLGERMAAAIATELARGSAAVIVVGTDCPQLDANVLTRAVSELAAADVVLGPATDGGYYLLGTRHAHAALFDGIPWSSPDTLRETIAACRNAGLVMGLLDARSDIDTAGDWREWVASGGDQPGCSPESGR